MFLQKLGRFNKQLAFNILPLLVDNEGSIQEERQMVDQIRKILQDDGLPISVTTLQAPVFYGHAQSVQLETSRPMGSEEARETLQERGSSILVMKMIFQLKSPMPPVMLA